MTGSRLTYFKVWKGLRITYGFFTFKSARYLPVSTVDELPKAFWET
jgi:hypothetical protein